jgi:arsenate reductase-like glutaredoxin family protein
VELDVKEMVDARKTRIGPSDLRKVLGDATSVTVAKGKKVTRFDLGGKVPRAELAAAMIGPTGNLRAPTLRRGKKVIVGFHEEALEEFLR